MSVVEKTLIVTINMKVFAFLPDSTLSLCGLETQIVCWNLAGCNEKCKFILLYNRRERVGKVWDLLPRRLLPSLQFLDECVQEEVPSVQDGIEVLVSWNELKEINCTGWQPSANCFGQTVPLDACVALQFLTEWNLSHKICYEELLQRPDSITVIKNSCLLQLALSSQRVTGEHKECSNWALCRQGAERRTADSLAGDVGQD